MIGETFLRVATGASLSQEWLSFNNQECENRSILALLQSFHLNINKCQGKTVPFEEKLGECSSTKAFKANFWPLCIMIRSLCTKLESNDGYTFLIGASLQLLKQSLMHLMLCL